MGQPWPKVFQMIASPLLPVGEISSPPPPSIPHYISHTWHLLSYKQTISSISKDSVSTMLWDRNRSSPTGELRLSALLHGC